MSLREAAFIRCHLDSDGAVVASCRGRCFGTCGCDLLPVLLPCIPTRELRSGFVERTIEERLCSDEEGLCPFPGSFSNQKTKEKQIGALKHSKQAVKKKKKARHPLCVTELKVGKTVMFFSLPELILGN